MERTQDQHIEFGIGAGHLLNENEAFITACESVKDLLTEDLLNTEPAEADKREHCYAQLQALSAIISELVSMYAIKQEIATRHDYEQRNTRS